MISWKWNLCQLHVTLPCVDCPFLGPALAFAKLFPCRVYTLGTSMVPPSSIKEGLRQRRDLKTTAFLLWNVLAVVMWQNNHKCMRNFHYKVYAACATTVFCCSPLTRLTSSCWLAIAIRTNYRQSTSKHLDLPHRTCIVYVSEIAHAAFIQFMWPALLLVSGDF